MSKLYVFGIGGTGSRVLKSLTMLLASGVKCNADTIVPIIIDPDDSGADKTRTIDLMKSKEGQTEEIQNLKEQLAQALIDVVHDFDASWNA